MPKVEVWCHKCGCEMKLRQNKKNKSWFWGCTGYPVCKNTLSELEGRSQGGHKHIKIRLCDVCGKRPAEDSIPECSECAKLNGDYANVEEDDFFHPGHPRFYGDNETMTVKELIEKLQVLPPDLKVKQTSGPWECLYEIKRVYHFKPKELDWEEYVELCDGVPYR